MSIKIKGLRNLTPHPVKIKLGEEEIILEPCGIIPRVRVEETPAERIAGIPCISQRMGEIEGLPDPEPGVFYLVSSLVFGATDRKDVLAPDTGKTCIRDERGNIIAVTRLIRKEER